jgi:tRNA(fMet)-specific endonuclease VapC
MKYVLDTNIITAILKANKKVKDAVEKVIMDGNEILINGISYYEIRRGFLAADATTQLNSFDQFSKKFSLLLLDTKSIFDEAAEIYAYLKKKGNLIEDADILIASTVKIGGFTLVSDDDHFQRIQGLQIENWLT